MTEIVFTSFGLTVLDEIKHPTLGTLSNILGGSGTYATFGARLIVGQNASRSVAWELHAGEDFPPELQQMIRSWDLCLSSKIHKTNKTTRGLLVYEDSLFGAKSFKYTAPPSLILPGSGMAEPLKVSKGYHFLGRACDFRAQLNNLTKLREKHEHAKKEKPFIVWEPAPPFCCVEEFSNTVDAASLTDVFSPNHIELAKLCGINDLSENRLSNELLENLAQKFLMAVKNKQLWIVVRVSSRGCFILSSSVPVQWIPSFYPETDQLKVIDPTGAGNAFLGGLTAAYVMTQDMIEACYSGATAASFAVEQIGVPTLHKCKDGAELWNGDSFSNRLAVLKNRCSTV